MELEDKLMSGPIKQSVNSVFNGVNSFAEALDLFKKYQKYHFSSIKENVSNIHILGMSKPIKLIDIYTPTTVSTSIHRRLYEQDWRDIKNKEKLIRSNNSSETVKAIKFVEGNRKTLILGAPGSGKTTFSKFLALANIDNGVFKKSGLKERFFPFYISLPAFSELDESIDLDTYMMNKLQKGTDEHASGFVRRKLSKKNCVVLLDSLDEVPTSKRSYVFAKINDFVEQYTAPKIVVSCRVSDYNGGLNSFSEVEIARLSEEAIKKVVRAWFHGNHKKASLLLNHLRVDGDVYSLTETPLLLSLLCIQFKHDLNIPNRKTELYRRCIDALLRTWDTSRDFRRDTAFALLSDDRKEKIFEHVAYEFIQNDFSYLFTRDDLISKIAEKTEKYDGIQECKSDEVLDEIESHHGILERYSVEAYFFSHPSFQEYFAAKALISKRSEAKFIKDHYNDPRAYTIIPFVTSLSDEPLPLLDFLVKKSDMTGKSTYPAMARRTNVLYLLYKAIISGVAIKKEDRENLHNHIVQSQIVMSSIYGDGGVYPIATLETDGIRHSYYYSRKRQSLYDALQPFRKLSNEILLSPCDDYSNAVISCLNEIEIESNNIIQICNILCLVMPVVSSKPNEVEIILKRMDEKVSTKYQFVKDIITISLDNLNRYWKGK